MSYQIKNVCSHDESLTCWGSIFQQSNMNQIPFELNVTLIQYI